MIITLKKMRQDVFAAAAVPCAHHTLIQWICVVCVSSVRTGFYCNYTRREMCAHEWIDAVIVRAYTFMHGRCDHSVCVDCLWFWLCAARWYKYRQLGRITDSVTCYRRDTSGSGFHSIYRRQHSLCFRSLDQNGTGRHFINRIDTHEIKKEKKNRTIATIHRLRKLWLSIGSLRNGRFAPCFLLHAKLRCTI